MTATDLYEIVRDVPREAWPEFMYFDGHGWSDEDLDVYFSDAIAESAFVGSMTAWLAAQDHEVRHWSPVDELTDAGRVPCSWCVALDDNDIDKATVYGTLVAALAAACKEVGK